METLLICADSQHCADMLYAVGMFVPDPFIYFQHHGRSAIVVSDLEIDRAKREARVDEIISLSELSRPLEKRLGRRVQCGDVIAALFRKRRIRSARVPATFPLALADFLRRQQIRVWTDEKPFFPQRELKSAEEVKKIEQALRITEAGLTAGIGMIRASKITRDGRLTIGGVTLTSESVRAEINASIIRRGGLPAHTIVAGGKQACDPHAHGTGPLRAHESIILDVFPRDEQSGYFGDMTRTVVRGKASEALQRQFTAVHDAQQLAIRFIRAGADGRKVHQAVQHLFEERGFKTGSGINSPPPAPQPETPPTRMQGFFHGTGHGLGLEIHEMPRIGLFSVKLRAGHVVTVEPGLYYLNVGGVRIEDVVLVTQTGARKLSKFPVVLEV